MSSPKTIGLCTRFLMKKGNISVIRASADIMDTIDGGEQYPGGKFDYHILYRLKERRINDLVMLSFNAGPGVAVGYVNDFHKKKGLMSGLSGLASLDFIFSVPVVISISLSGIVGCHLSVRDRYDSTMTLYRNGMTLACLPEVSIRYRF